MTRAELEEQSFATKRELAAIKQHDLDTNQQLEIARDKIRKLSEVRNLSSLNGAILGPLQIVFLDCFNTGVKLNSRTLL